LLEGSQGSTLSHLSEDSPVGAQGFSEGLMKGTQRTFSRPSEAPGSGKGVLYIRFSKGVVILLSVYTSDHPSENI